MGEKNCNQLNHQTKVYNPFLFCYIYGETIDKFVGIDTVYLCPRPAAEEGNVGRTHSDWNYVSYEI